MQPSSPSHNIDEGDFDNGANSADTNGILAVSDSTGHLHSFLDGSYPLGPVTLMDNSTTASLFADFRSTKLFVHQRRTLESRTSTTILPLSINMTLLEGRIPRDVAKVSTTARELLWYMMRVVEEMRVAWFGSGSQTGARELGIKWLQGLESLQPHGCTYQASTIIPDAQI